MDKETTERYARQAKTRWGHTEAYREFEEKSKDRSAEDERAIAVGLMAIFGDFGRCKEGDPASCEAQSLVRRLRDYITAHYYPCTPEILRALGQAYAAGGEFTENIDAAGGPGTAQFAHRAIEAYRG